MSDIQTKREKIINNLLQIVPFSGWNDSAMQEACEKAGLDKESHKIYFSDGPKQAITMISKDISDRMVNKISELDIEKMSIRDKIKNALLIRLELYSNHKMLIRKNFEYFSMPQNSIYALKELYNTVDIIWKAIGDKSISFDYYTKRLTLSAIYTSTILYWFSDESENYQETKDFIDRRITDVMEFHKFKQNPLEYLQNIFN